MTMLEMLARAILAKVPFGYGMNEPEAVEYVRAVLLALRSPDEGMVEAMEVGVDECSFLNGPVHCLAVWQAAIDYILTSEAGK